MIVDVHAHVIVPEITREVGGDEPWRPSVRWEDGAQVVEFDGQAIRSATREFVRIERLLEEEASSGIDFSASNPSSGCLRMTASSSGSSLPPMSTRIP